MSISNTKILDNYRPRTQGIPSASIVWQTADGDINIEPYTLGFIACHSSLEKVNVKMKLKNDETADVVTVFTGIQYDADISQIVADETTATKIIVRV